MIIKRTYSEQLIDDDQQQAKAMDTSKRDGAEPKEDECCADIAKKGEDMTFGRILEQTEVCEDESYGRLDDPKAEIRRLNTILRRTGVGGMTYMTSGVMGLPAEIKAKCLEFLQRDYSEGIHNPDNDPFDEYDFGTIEYEGHLLFWKIDYYDLDFMHHSPDPADENVTKRVLTIMLASEY